MKDVPLPEAHRPTTYQLTDGSVSPTRIIDRTEEGDSIEETISCYPRREMFVDRAGNVCDVVLCNSRTSSHNNEAQMYAAQVRGDWIRASGLPLAECPFASSTEYKKMIGSATLVKVPKGEVACEGQPDGCEHIQKIINQRRAATRKKHDQQEARASSITSAQLEQMGKTFGQEIAAALGAHSPAKAALVAGRGEKD